MWTRLSGIYVHLNEIILCFKPRAWTALRHDTCGRQRFPTPLSRSSSVLWRGLLTFGTLSIQPWPIEIDDSESPTLGQPSSFLGHSPRIQR